MRAGLGVEEQPHSDPCFNGANNALYYLTYMDSLCSCYTNVGYLAHDNIGVHTGETSRTTHVLTNILAIRNQKQRGILEEGAHNGASWTQDESPETEHTRVHTCSICTGVPGTYMSHIHGTLGSQGHM